MLFVMSISSSKTSLAIFWLNILEIIIINVVPLMYKNFYVKRVMKKDVLNFVGSNVIIFCLMSSLLHKPHNVILNGVCILTCRMMNKACQIVCRDDGRRIILYQIFGHILIGKLFFFYQGNSNSLASIDLNAGYIGLEQYNMTLVGLFLTINTYSGVILSFLLMIYHLYEGQACNKVSTHNTYINVIHILWLIMSFQLYLVVMVIFRNHIFVWTVFSPKLFYEFYQMILMFTILIVNYLFNKYFAYFGTI